RPGLGITEERRHIDKDRVEEVLELVGMNLQIVDVVLVVVEADLLHPLLDSTREGCPLVTGEVERARSAEMLEQLLEAHGIVCIRRCRPPPFSQCLLRSPGCLLRRHWCAIDAMFAGFARCPRDRVGTAYR